MKKILIIGAGMAGLSAARILHKNGHDVTVLDKGRGYGGRMSTRRLGAARIDYGAQYFSAKTTGFQALVKEAEAAGAVRKWQPDHASDGHPRWVGADGMTRFPKFLAAGLNVKRKTRVVRLSENENGWEAHTEAGEVFSAEAVIATMPAPQAIDLLKKSDLDFPQTVRELSRIEYDPCLAVLAQLDRQLELGSLMPHESDEKNPIAWLANNQAKGITDQPCVTIHPTPTFSQEHLDGDLQAAGKILLQAASKSLEPAQVTDWQIHRWRYSLARERFPEKYWKVESAHPLLFGGDGFGIGNVEGAFLSGEAMANNLMENA
jgi:predicted NAD/FAD-dependent oxidoreductase